MPATDSTTTHRTPLIRRARSIAVAALCIVFALPASASLAITGGASASAGGAAPSASATQAAGGGVYGQQTTATRAPNRVSSPATKTTTTTKPTPATTKKASSSSSKTTAKGATRSVSPTKKVRKLGSRLPLKSGMEGSDVKALQQALATVGESIDIDGGFGPETAKVLADWQASAALVPDGVLDASDLSALNQQVASAIAASTSTAVPPTSPLTATIGPDGLAVAPPGAPAAVTAAIAAANAIATTPYVYGGGHKSFTDTAYDCSGSVSYALHGADLLDATMTSGELESWGQPGIGQWITVYANADHTFMVIAGIRFDTSGQKQAGGTRWQPLTTRSTYTGFVVRHPAGL